MVFRYFGKNNLPRNGELYKILTECIIPGEYNAKTTHIDLIYFWPSDTAVAIFLEFKDLVNKITGKCSEK